GMDAVHEAVHTLAGALTIQSQSGHGSHFIMRLPITVSIIHALIVQCGQFEIAFPLTVVMRTLELKHSEIIEDRGGSTIRMDGFTLPLRSLRQVLHLPPPETEGAALLPVLVCDVSGTLTAFEVDHIFGQQEIFVRPLKSPLSHLRGVSGAAIAGDGRVLFVADASALA
ncbi:MAG: chemotaxis protein CheW, partial [Desulfuromonadaceae bacterium]|nr:chemotaxis protein CheW [Desulfuromonadaceae bacterium]